jgi:hypothetical protein
MKSFRDQFIQCRKDGLNHNTEFVSFNDHPEMLPAFPTPTMKEQINNGSMNGLDLLLCGRFEGRCSSANRNCRLLRKGILQA